jgi:hypothetical protein
LQFSKEVVLKIPSVVVGVVALCLAIPSFAEFQYTETTSITGGSVVGMMKMAGTFSKQARQANEPITTTIIVKGNRMVRINPTYSEIVDLDKETVTHIDMQHKTYTVMTFQQMKQQMEDAARQAREKQSHAQQPPPQAPQDPNTKLSFHVNVRNTPNTKQVAGLDAAESILTMTMEAQDTKSGDSGNMAITNDMWMVPEVPGYAEVRDFERRYALKMGAMFNEAVGSATLASLQPGAGEGMAEMVKEMSKLKGTPVLQIMRMGTTANGQPLPAASEAPIPESNSPAMPSAGQVAKDSVASSISNKLGGLGGLGGFGHKKKADAPPPDEKPADQPPPQSAVLLESKTELTSFSRGPVDVSKFEVPAGYKQVEPRAARGE